MTMKVPWYYNYDNVLMVVCTVHRLNIDNNRQAVGQAGSMKKAETSKICIQTFNTFMIIDMKFNEIKF